MSTYAIGDIHGCFAELQKLLSLVAFNPEKDRLWLVGDLINRGPQSLEVLRFVKFLGSAATVVLGNHELYALYLHYHNRLLNNFPHLKVILSAPDSTELLAWLRQKPLLHYDVSLGYVMVHAGILPEWSLVEAQSYAHEVEEILRGPKYADFLYHMEGNKPVQWSENLSGWERLRFITNCFTRMRFCDAGSRLNLTCKAEIGTQPPGFMPWYMVPNRKTKKDKIIFGHWAALAGQVYEPNVYALDTGCVWGERLTALRLEDGRKFAVNKYIS